jgi:dihydroflavonol-4-reductase
MRVTVTGASGHIGANLVRALLAAGHRVTVLRHSPSRSLEGLAVAEVEGDVRDPAAVARSVAGAEAVFHLAARVTIDGDRGDDLRAVNVGGTEHVARACLTGGVRRLVHFSSVHALAPEPFDRPLDESRPLADPARALPYDASKAAAEAVILEAVRAGLDAVVVSPTAVLGPHDWAPSALGGVVLDVARRRLPTLVDAGFDWVDVRDVAAGAVAALSRGRAGERYLLSGRWAPFAELALAVADAAGVPAPSFTSPLWLAAAAAPLATAWARLTGAPAHLTRASVETLRHSHRDVRHDKAARELGYAPRPLAETAADTVAWFRAAGLLGVRRPPP